MTGRWIVRDRDNTVIYETPDRIEAEVYMDGRTGLALDWKADEG